MAFNKNQHYVPRAYLRPFTDNSDNIIINLYNIRRRDAVPKAPVKSQCSRDYFYGQDENLEDAIRFIEGSYSTVLKHILQSEKPFGAFHKTVLRRFAFLQYLRTEAAARAMAQMTALMVDVPGVEMEIPSVPEQLKEAIQAAMLHYAERMSIVDDLKVCLIRNSTSTPFVTSDNPCILANRWYQKDHRTRQASFGVSKAGIIFFLPLSPEFACVIYDGDVYSIPNKGGYVAVKKSTDIHLFNEQQVLGCGNNLYFQNWDHRAYVAKLYTESSPRRVLSTHRVTFAVLGETTAWGDRYEVVRRDQIQPGQDALIHVEAQHPVPSAWPSFIGFRPSGRVYSNGSGTGFVRAWCIDQGFVSGTGYRELKA